MTLIILIVAFWAMAKACESVRVNARQKEAERQRQLAMMGREQIRQAKEQAKLEKEQERQQAVAMKEEAKAEVTRQKKEQAEADIEYITHRLDTVSDLLNMADSELADVETQIEINESMHKYDANKKLNQQKEKLHKKILGYEATIHSLESKLAKANYVLSM